MTRALHLIDTNCAVSGWMGPTIGEWGQRVMAAAFSFVTTEVFNCKPFLTEKHSSIACLRPFFLILIFTQFFKNNFNSK